MCRVLEFGGGRGLVYNYSSGIIKLTSINYWTVKPCLAAITRYFSFYIKLITDLQFRPLHNFIFIYLLLVLFRLK